MIAVVQRVKQSAVTVDGKITGEINGGLTVLLGVADQDTEKDARYLADKIVNLRIFEDHNHKMNLSLSDVGGKMLVISQFTLLGDCRKGRRPSFVKAAPPEKAKPLYHHFIDCVNHNKIQTQTGKFQAEMDVSILNSGPVTLIVSSR